MAGTTGLEPAASAVTGQRSNQLNYVPTRQINEMRNNQCLCGFAQIAYRAWSCLCCLKERDSCPNRPQTAYKFLSCEFYPSTDSERSEALATANRKPILLVLFTAEMRRLSASDEALRFLPIRKKALEDYNGLGNRYAPNCDGS